MVPQITRSIFRQSKNHQRNSFDGIYAISEKCGFFAETNQRNYETENALLMMSAIAKERMISLGLFSFSTAIVSQSLY